VAHSNDSVWRAINTPRNNDDRANAGRKESSGDSPKHCSDNFPSPIPDAEKLAQREPNNANGPNTRENTRGNAGWSHCKHGHWDGEWKACSDGKSRIFAPGVQLLADGPPGELAGPLSGFGNAIIPRLAAEFISASIEAIRG
jgi:hypothetical protein